MWRLGGEDSVVSAAPVATPSVVVIAACAHRKWEKTESQFSSDLLYTTHFQFISFFFEFFFFNVFSNECPWDLSWKREIVENPKPKILTVPRHCLSKLHTVYDTESANKITFWLFFYWEVRERREAQRERERERERDFYKKKLIFFIS